MLSSTFQHIQGVGEKSERKLWRKGCVSWDSVLEKDFGLEEGRYRRLKAGVLESCGRLEDLDNSYFRERLDRNITWRAYDSFREHVCFLDIETTGLSPESSHVTAVCVHSRNETKSYVYEKNMGELASDLQKYKYIVTFNGARFDLPFLTRNLGISFPQIHLDLMNPMRQLGLRGGLKHIEKEMGIARDTDGVTGYDAVRLWRAYRSDREVEVAGRSVRGEDALDLLVRYNEEDTVNLERLTESAVDMLRKETMRFINSSGP